MCAPNPGHRRRGIFISGPMPLSRAEYLGDRYFDFKRQRVVEDNAIMQKIGHLIHGKIVLNIIID